jgi:hypothetical protein
MSDTYTATLIGSESTESVELEFIDGLPQKSFVRPSSDEHAEEVVWELIDGSEGADGFEYREVGSPGADYS